MGLDAHKKMVRAARVFEVPGAVKNAATTLAFAPLFPKANGRIRMLDNGLFDDGRRRQRRERPADQPSVSLNP
jgi:hypothetical protein